MRPRQGIGRGPVPLQRGGRRILVANGSLCSSSKRMWRTWRRIPGNGQRCGREKGGWWVKSRRAGIRKMKELQGVLKVEARLSRSVYILRGGMCKEEGADYCCDG